MKPHAFIAMPFGTKPGADGQPINFDRVFDELLGPALRDAGFDVVRADEEQRAGDIRTDMFQELLAADLVLADLTIDNPNVWYELGVRHALRSRGVILVQGPRPTQPFDIYTDRKFNYALKDGAPDPATLAADRAAIADMARESHAASTRRKVSPVYALLPHLEPPQWQQLLMAGDNEFSAAYAVWKSRLEVARQKKRAGDILVLAGETPVRALATEAYLAAGRALLQLWQGGFALEQIDAALAFDPECLPARQQRVVCLCRLHQFDEAREAAQALLRTHPHDAEALALAGRVEKEAWIERFRPPGAPPAAPGTLREAARGEDALLAEAIAPYLRGFVADPAHFYSGINALTLNVLRAHLEGEHDPALTDRLLAGLRWAIVSALERAPKDYWARASLAELSLLCFGADAVRRDWKNAVAASNKDWFALDSSRQTLQLLSELGFRPEETALALAIVQAEIHRLSPPFVPRQVLLFSGHMVDAPGRPKPRFRPAMVPAATAQIERALDELGAGPEDLALTQGAAGGDLIFTEACQARGVRVQWLQPLPEPDFLEASVTGSGDGAEWRRRYFAAKAALHPAEPPRTMPAEIGPLPKGVDKWERGNLWLLYTALAHGPDKARFVCLWDGGGSDGPGGTKHMFDEVKRRTGRVSWIDTRTL
jgi:tetratricopeptide (TPR) repeat protein